MNTMRTGVACVAIAVAATLAPPPAHAAPGVWDELSQSERKRTCKTYNSPAWSSVVIGLSKHGYGKKGRRERIRIQNFLARKC